MMDPTSYFSFQLLLHDWCNKGCGTFTISNTGKYMLQVLLNHHFLCGLLAGTGKSSIGPTGGIDLMTYCTMNRYSTTAVFPALF